jgi:phospholipase/carboxylesterase
MTTRFSYNTQQQQYRIADENVFLKLRWRRFFSYGISSAEELSQEEKTSYFPDFLPETGVALYVPEHYEPNYPYPLLIWLDNCDSSSSDEWELNSLMSQISTRNYVGMSFHGSSQTAKTLQGGSRCSKSDQQIERLLRHLHSTVCKLREVCHIHSERIYLAGIGESATMALRLLVERPEWFAGAISLGGKLPKSIDISAGHQNLQIKRVFQGYIQQDVTTQQPETAQTDQIEWLLRKAGMQVVSKSYDTRAKVSSKMLQDINHWVMESICSGV